MSVFIFKWRVYRVVVASKNHANNVLTLFKNFLLFADVFILPWIFALVWLFFL